MSTKSEIHIYGRGVPIILFHYHDGYPECVGYFLIEQVYNKLLMRTNKYSASDIAEYLCTHPRDAEFELTDKVHPDINFLYEINVPAKTIKCFKGHYKTHNYRGHKLKRPRFDKYLEYDLKAMFLPLNRRVKYA